MLFTRKHATMVDAASALPGRDRETAVPQRHEVLGTPLTGPFPEGVETAVFGMGCFWGAERIFWQAPGVYTTAVGYAGGFTRNPTYEEVCSGRTGHTEAVLVVFDPQQTSYEEILRLFWENHDPTQGMRQGNDQGTQYRSAIYWTSDAQRAAAEASRAMYEQELARAGYDGISTELAEKAWTVGRDPKAERKKRLAWGVLQGALSAAATIAARRLGAKAYGVLTSERPPVKR